MKKVNEEIKVEILSKKIISKTLKRQIATIVITGHNKFLCETEIASDIETKTKLKANVFKQLNENKIYVVI